MFNLLHSQEQFVEHNVPHKFFSVSMGVKKCLLLFVTVYALYFLFRRPPISEWNIAIKQLELLQFTRAKAVQNTSPVAEAFATIRPHSKQGTNDTQRPEPRHTSLRNVSRIDIAILSATYYDFPVGSVITLLRNFTNSSAGMLPIRCWYCSTRKPTITGRLL